MIVSDSMPIQKSTAPFALESAGRARRTFAVIFRPDAGKTTPTKSFSNRLGRPMSRVRTCSRWPSKHATWLVISDGSLGDRPVLTVAPLSPRVVGDRQRCGDKSAEARVHARFRTFGSRSQCRAGATAAKALSDTTPASGLTPALSSRAWALASAPMVFTCA
jgi:hypothetical protein